MRKNKYGNIKVVVDNITFDSKKEVSFYKELKLRKAIGDIIDFALKPKFELMAGFTNYNGTKVRSINYIADFVIYHDGKTEIVDVKGVKTEVFNIKWKLLQYKYREKGYIFTII